MNLRRHLRTIFMISMFACLNLSHAQTTAVPAGTPLRSVTIPSTPQQPSTTPTATGVPSSGSLTEGMFSEYQSYCRQNNVDEKAPGTPEQKKKHLEDLKARVQADPQNSALKTELVIENLRQFHYREAEDMFAKMRQQLPPQQLALAGAAIDAEKKAYRSAVVKLEEYLAQHPKDKAVLLALADIYKQQENYYEAKAALLDLERYYKSEDFSLELCEVYALDSNHKDTEDVCFKATKRYQDNPLPWIFIGISMREQERYKEATKAFQRATSIRPTEFAWTCLGEIYILQKDPRSAVNAFKQAIEVYKYSNRALMGLASTQMQLKQYNDALETFKMACRVGTRSTTEMRKARKTLEDLKSPLAETYSREVQRCEADKSASAN